VLLGVMAHMKEQRVAPIMEAMDPMKAKTITDAMAMRRGAKTEGQGGG
jgi:flagellar motility protein MotE (MotC chaperone)